MSPSYSEAVQSLNAFRMRVEEGESKSNIERLLDMELAINEFEKNNAPGKKTDMAVLRMRAPYNDLLKEDAKLRNDVVAAKRVEAA